MKLLQSATNIQIQHGFHQFFQDDHGDPAEHKEVQQEDAEVPGDAPGHGRGREHGEQQRYQQERPV